MGLFFTSACPRTEERSSLQHFGCSRVRLLKADSAARLLRLNEDFQFAEASFTDIGSPCGDDPTRRTRGAIGARPGARASDSGRVVRPTVGLTRGSSARKNTRLITSEVVGSNPTRATTPKGSASTASTCKVEAPVGVVACTGDADGAGANFEIEARR